MGLRSPRSAPGTATPKRRSGCVRRRGWLRRLWTAGTPRRRRRGSSNGTGDSRRRLRFDPRRRRGGGARRALLAEEAGAAGIGGGGGGDPLPRAGCADPRERGPASRRRGRRRRDVGRTDRRGGRRRRRTTRRGRWRWPSGRRRRGRWRRSTATEAARAATPPTRFWFPTRFPDAPGLERIIARASGTSDAKGRRRRTTRTTRTLRPRRDKPRVARRCSPRRRHRRRPRAPDSIHRGRRRVPSRRPASTRHRRYDLDVVNATTTAARGRPGGDLRRGRQAVRGEARGGRPSRPPPHRRRRRATRGGGEGDRRRQREGRSRSEEASLGPAGGREGSRRGVYAGESPRARGAHKAWCSSAAKGKDARGGPGLELLRAVRDESHAAALARRRRSVPGDERGCSGARGVVGLWVPIRREEEREIPDAPGLERRPNRASGGGVVRRFARGDAGTSIGSAKGRGADPGSRGLIVTREGDDGSTRIRSTGRSWRPRTGRRRRGHPDALSVTAGPAEGRRTSTAALCPRGIGVGAPRPTPPNGVRVVDDANLTHREAAASERAVADIVGVPASRRWRCARFGPSRRVDDVVPPGGSPARRRRRRRAPVSPATSPAFLDGACALLGGSRRGTGGTNSTSRT